jgi:hypothetical protein
MGIPHAIMAGIVGKFSKSWTEHPGAGWFGVALICKSSKPRQISSALTTSDTYILCFGASYSPLAWVMPAEVYPSSRRATGVVLSTAVNWLANFVIGVSVPPIIIGIGHGTYAFFACFCFLAATFAFFLVPETSGKTLEQMDQVFKDALGKEEMALKESVVGA